MARKLVTAKSRQQAVAIGMSKSRKHGDGQVVGYEVHQYKRGKPSPRGAKRLAKKR